MRAWRWQSPNLLDIRPPDQVAHDFDATMQLILRHLGFTDAELPAALAAAATQDIARMDDAAVAAN